MAFLRADVDFVIMKQGVRDGRTGACIEWGRVLAAELASRR